MNNWILSTMLLFKPFPWPLLWAPAVFGLFTSDPPCLVLLTTLYQAFSPMKTALFCEFSQIIAQLQTSFVINVHFFAFLAIFLCIIFHFIVISFFLCNNRGELIMKSQLEGGREYVSRGNCG